MIKNPTYAPNTAFAGDFKTMPERYVYMRRVDDPATTQHPSMSVGVKTITHNRDGMKITPQDVVVIDASEPDNLISFEISSNSARTLAKRLIEFADQIDGENNHG